MSISPSKESITSEPIPPNKPAANFSNRPKHYSRRSLFEKPLPLSVRVWLVPPKRGQPYSNPHPLEVSILVGNAKTGQKSRANTYLDNSILVDPTHWSIEAQASRIKSAPVNKQV